MKGYTVRLLALAYHGYAAIVAAAPQPADPKEMEAIAYCEQHSSSQIRLIPAPDGKGGWKTEACAGTVYKHPMTGSMGCCELGSTFQTDAAAATTEGACCSHGQNFSFDTTSGKGQCCPSEHSFIGGSCRAPKFEMTEYVTNSCPKVPNEFVCACDGNLGIKYGHCYTMTDINGLQLNRDLAGQYQSGGDIGNLIFKVCKSTKDCNEQSGTLVPEDGTWCLQDQLGDRTTPGPGWFANVLPHMMINNNAVFAAVFKAEAFSFFGDCSLCLRLATGPYLGVSSPCPLFPYSNLAHLGAAINPNNCKAYRFQEIKCVKGVN